MDRWARLDGRTPDGRFVVRAGDQAFHATRVYLNVGTTPSLPPIPGLAEAQPLTSDTLLALDQIPAELVVIGGSYIGLELARSSLAWAVASPFSRRCPPWRPGRMPMSRRGSRRCSRPRGCGSSPEPRFVRSRAMPPAPSG